MEKIINELTDNFNMQVNKIVNEYNLLKDSFDNKNKTIQSLTEDNHILKIRINEMIEEKKSKSSSALWESTQLQLGEKDLIIDNLKKDIEFYKRNHKNNNVIDKNKNIIDLGAWIGDNSIPWAKNIDGIVYAIDPSKENCKYIYVNFKFFEIIIFFEYY